MLEKNYNEPIIKLNFYFGGNKMKKLIALLLSLMMLLALFTGCSIKVNRVKGADGVTTTSQAENETQLNEQTEQPSLEQAQTEEKTEEQAQTEVQTQKNTVIPTVPNTQKPEAPSKKPEQPKKNYHDSAFVGTWVMTAKMYFDENVYVPFGVTIEFNENGTMRSYVTEKQERDVAQELIKVLFPTEEILNDALAQTGCESKEELVDLIVKKAHQGETGVPPTGYWRAYDGKLYEYKNKQDYDNDTRYSDLSASYKVSNGGKTITLITVTGEKIVYNKVK